MKKRYVVIADDLTGANDTGIQFLKFGNSTSVLLDPTALADSELDTVVLNTESRNVSTQKAQTILADVAQRLKTMKGDRAVYKKVDSTLRGNIAVEVEALRHELDFALTVFTPAYPANGRTVRDGICLLDGLPVDKTEIGYDLRKPVSTSSLCETIGGDARVVSLDELRSERVSSIMRASRGGVLACDAETDEDLRRIVAGVRKTFPEKDVLWVGSAGLAEALAAPPPVLFVVGSLSQRSREQSRCLLSRDLAAPVLMDMDSFLSDAAAEGYRMECDARALLTEGKNVLLSSGLEEEQAEVGRRSKVEAMVTGLMAAVTYRIVRSAPLSGLFLTGGETAFYAVKALGGLEMVLLREVEPGIPLVRMAGGGGEWPPIVTKAGAFGSEEAMVRALDVFRELRSPESWREGGLA